MKKIFFKLLGFVSIGAMFILSSCENTPPPGSPESRDFNATDASTLINTYHQSSSTIASEIEAAGFQKTPLGSDDDEATYSKVTMNGSQAYTESIVLEWDDDDREKRVEDITYMKNGNYAGLVGKDYLKKSIESICSVENARLDKDDDNCYILVGSVLTGDRMATFSNPSDFYTKAVEAIDNNYDAGGEFYISVEIEAAADAEYSLSFERWTGSIGGYDAVTESITIEAEDLSRGVW